MWKKFIYSFDHDLTIFSLFIPKAIMRETIEYILFMTMQASTLIQTCT